MEGRVGGLIKTVSFPSPLFYILFFFSLCFWHPEMLQHLCIWISVV